MVKGAYKKKKQSFANKKRAAAAIVKMALKPGPSMPLIKGKERVSGFYGRYNLPGGGSENKFFDTSMSFTFDATGEVPATGQLCLIPQGVTESTRVGRKAVIKSIHIRGTAVGAPDVLTAYTQSIYFYVVLDKQCNGAAAAVTDVLTSSDMSVAMINLANSERFVILKRIVKILEPSAGVSGAYNGVRKNFEWFHKCNIPLEFSSTTGAITEIRSNNVFILAGQKGPDDFTEFTGTCRLRFSDD